MWTAWIGAGATLPYFMLAHSRIKFQGVADKSGRDMYQMVTLDQRPATGKSLIEWPGFVNRVFKRINGLNVFVKRLLDLWAKFLCVEVVL
jgi:hypothetical protein